MTYPARSRLGVVFLALTLAAPFLGTAPAGAVAPGECKAAICWEIVNRFRLFADQTDFQPHVDAWRATEKDGHSVLAMERWLHAQKAFEKRGWAESVFQRKSGLGVCFDETSNRVASPCLRDGAKESYLDPAHFLVRLHVAPPPGFENALCKWSADRGFVDRAGNLAPAPDGCRDADGKDVEARVRKGATKVKVTLQTADNKTWSQDIVIEPRVATVVGMGDSFTSGDGNPDVPVRLESVGATGMCFKRVLGNQKFWLPSRAIKGSQDCFDTAGEEAEKITDREWSAARARWLYAPCHRSLYGHQLRAAIALAVEDVHRSIAYIPLGCTGAEIQTGLLRPQKARERTLRLANSPHPQNAPAQIPSLRAQLNGAKPDLVFLTIGGNDIGFVQLAANIIVAQNPERGLLAKADYLFDAARAKAKLKALRTNFRALRAAMRPMLGGDLSKVVYTPYGNPLTHGAAKQMCGDARRGYDAHPALSFNASHARATSKFMEEDLIPTLKALATCEKPGDCAAPEKEAMLWADTHREAFSQHGICARYAADDPAFKEPAFDEVCLADDHTFHQWGDQGDGLTKPFRKCNLSPAAWRPYASRARWMRTPNDSYLTAMTYADSLPKALHGLYVTDAIWGISGVLYGGAAHPTAEGHAAMADADLVEARKALTKTP